MGIQTHHIRKRIYEIVEKDRQHDKISALYDRYILVLVCLSAVPLLFKIWNQPIFWLDRIVTALFILDYFLRWITADFSPRMKGLSLRQSMLRYPVTPMAIIDLLAILPVVTTFPAVMQLLPDMPLTKYIQVLRIMRVFRCVRFLKTMRYARSFISIYRAVRRERKLLIMVLMLSMVYSFVSAAVMFSVEPNSFDSFFEALYWAFAMLTTVGYGDIYPVTRIGRLVSMVSSVFGTAVIAMPAGILTAGFMEEINKVRFKDERKLEQEVSELLDEIKQLRKEQAERGLEEKIEKIAAQVEQVQEHRDQDAVLLQDLSEDLKNALARGTINEIKEEAEQV